MSLHIPLVADESLERYLAKKGMTWELLPASRHAALEREWESLYGNVWRLGLPHKQGARAEAEYLQQSAEAFFIVPFLGDHAGPHGLGKKGPRTAAYKCHGAGELPDLSAFASIDCFISPPDYRWTMVHTHEDHALGGPYFIEKESPAGSIRKTGRSR